MRLRESTILHVSVQVGWPKAAEEEGMGPGGSFRGELLSANGQGCRGRAAGSGHWLSGLPLRLNGSRCYESQK